MRRGKERKVGQRRRNEEGRNGAPRSENNIERSAERARNTENSLVFSRILSTLLQIKEHVRCSAILGKLVHDRDIKDCCDAAAKSNKFPEVINYFESLEYLVDLR